MSTGTDKLNVNDIFLGYSGETGGKNFQQGVKCLFLRMQQCNLGCVYCDAPTAKKEGGVVWEADALVNTLTQRMGSHGVNRLLITGGEPLLQQEALFYVLTMMRQKIGPFITQIETNGTIRAEGYWLHHPRHDITWVVDVKTPGSVNGKRTLADASAYQYAARTAESSLGVVSRFLNTDRDDIVLKYVLCDLDRDTEFMFWHMKVLASLQEDDLQERNKIRAAFSIVRKEGMEEDEEAKVLWIQNYRHHPLFDLSLNVQIHKAFDLP